MFTHDGQHRLRHEALCEMDGTRNRRVNQSPGQEAYMNTIADHPTPEMYATGLEIDCACARCGSSCDRTHCPDCEDGLSHHDCGEDCCCCLNPEPNMTCDTCRGAGGWWTCLSSDEWCKAHPLPGREAVERRQIEWFTVEL